MTGPLREKRLLAVTESMDQLAERFVAGAPHKRFAVRRREMEEKSRKERAKI